MNKKKNKNNVNSNSNLNHDDVSIIPDVVELWKNMYFQSEEMWGKVVKEYITTSSFLNSIEKTRNQLLATYQMNNETLDKLVENNPFASKKDIAGIAELVISVEDKVDNLDYQLLTQMQSMAASIMKLVDFQLQIVDDINSIKTKVDELLIKVDHNDVPRPKRTQVQKKNKVNITDTNS